MKLRIQNFQAHKDTTIEFDRITTIVGGAIGHRQIRCFAGA